MITSNLKLQVNFTGDVEYSQIFDWPQNGESPGSIRNYILAIGNNNIELPDSCAGVVIVQRDNVAQLYINEQSLFKQSITVIPLGGLQTLVVNSDAECPVTVIFF